METYEDIGDFSKKVTTNSMEGQIWINRAFVQLYGFNHLESINCFQKAIECDPDTPIAYWGISYCYGPHYNRMEMSKEDYNNANKYFNLAQEKKSLGLNWEQGLISALKYRYSDPMPIEGEEFHNHLVNFSNKMKELYEQFPDDLDITGIYTESVMNLRPWQLWTHDGKPYPEAVEAKIVLEKAINNGAPHPLIYHLYIHLLELSPFMREALPVADGLLEMTKGIGHLLHMPSHIYIQVGQYKKAIESNLRAIEADNVVLKRIGVDNFYTFYRCHNLHFLIWSAMFIGDYTLAIKYSEQISSEITQEVITRDADNMEFFAHMYLHVLVRFGKWDQILDAQIETRKGFFITIAIQRYARCIAFAVKDMIIEAEKEFIEFESAALEIPEKRRIGNNPACKVLEVAESMARGEMLYRKKQYEEAFNYLRKSVELSDNLIYDEPWDWPQPPRHALGALLLEQGYYEEAEKVYNDDLKVYPDNIWSLTGIHECFEKLEKFDEKIKIEKILELAKLNSAEIVKVSCFCRKNK